MSSTVYESDDGEDVVCPLCCEPMDLSDQNFLPCPCGYRVCMWCWHRIKENYTNRCPACRSEYSDDPHAFAAVDKEMVIKNENSKKKRAKQKDTDAASAAAAATAAREYQHALHLRHQHQHQQHMQHLHREQLQLQQQGGRGGVGAGTVGSVASRRDLANMRVVQRNLVYVTGLPSGLDSEDVLRRPENFGQYGKIYKIATSTSQGNVSAHITFAHKEDALACILATDGFWVEGRQLRSNFGTTKYCATYLRNVPCSNPDCLYLHELGDEEDRFTKEEIQQRSLIAPPIPAGVATTTGAGGPSGTGKRCSSPFLPPPVYESRDNGPSTSGSVSTARVMHPQVQQAAAASAAATLRGATRRTKPSVQASTQKPSTSAGVAWGGAGTTNGLSTQALGDRSAVGMVMNRRKGPVSAASPTASPHLQAHDAARLQEEWPSLADTAAPPSALPPTPAAQPAGRAGRNRRKKEKLQQHLLQQQSQQHPSEEVTDSSPHVAPISPSQEPSLPPASVLATAMPHPPSLSQPPGLGPMAGAPGLTPQGQPASVGVSIQGGVAGRGRAVFQQEAMPRTLSTGQDGSTSMFSNPFFDSNGARGAADPSAPLTAAPAPPGFSGLPSASVVAPTMSPVSSPSSTAAVMSSPHQVTSAPPAIAESASRPPPPSLFENQFRKSEDVFNGRLFSSSIGGGLFEAEGGVGMAAPPGASAAGGSASVVSATSGAVEVPSALRSDCPPTARIDAQGLSLSQPEAFVDASAGSLAGEGKTAGEDVDSRYTGHPDDSANGAFLGKPLASSSSTTSPFAATFGGGHFGGAFGSALFPVSVAQGGGAQSSTRSGNTEVGGADLSVDPFANSSGALAAMLGVTLPPVDSQSSLASKMRSGMGGVPRPNPAGQNSGAPHAHLPPRGGNPYAEIPRDMGHSREMHEHGKVVARDTSDGDRGHEYRHDYGTTTESSMHLEHRASRFSFAQDDSPGMPYASMTRSSPMGSDIRGSSGVMGSPSRPGQHQNHLHQHHQSHAHRPFGTSRPMSPAQLGEYVGPGGEGHFASPSLPPPSRHHHPSHHAHHDFQQQQQQQRLPQQQSPQPQQPPQLQPQQQQYSIQNGMAFLQKVLPGVPISYGGRHPPAGAGTGGQVQGQPQGQGVLGAPAGGGVGWGDNAAGQRVDPAQAFGSSLWTMAPAPNAPRQPQGNRGGGYGAW